MGNAIIFAVLNVDCVDGTPLDNRLSTVETSSVAVDIDVSLVEVDIDIYSVDWIDVSSVDWIDVYSVEVEIDSCSLDVVASNVDVVVGVCVVVPASLVPVVDCLSSDGKPDLKGINYYYYARNYCLDALKYVNNIFVKTCVVR